MVDVVKQKIFTSEYARNSLRKLVLPGMPDFNSIKDKFAYLSSFINLDLPLMVL